MHVSCSLADQRGSSLFGHLGILGIINNGRPHTSLCGEEGCLQLAARGFTVHSVQLWKCNPVLFDSNCQRISEQHVLCSAAAGWGGYIGLFG